MNTKDMRDTAASYDFVQEPKKAKEIRETAQLIDDLTDFAEWLIDAADCDSEANLKGYSYFIEQRDKLLTLGNGSGKDEN